MRFKPEQLELEIITKKNYLLVKPPKGINFWEILIGFSKLLSMPEFQDKNDLWIFRDGNIDFQYSDLDKIKDFAQKYYPKNNNGKKTAIVVETVLQRSLAELYAEIGKDLPRELGIFSDFKSAEDWIIES